MNRYDEAIQILNKRFGTDTLISLATTAGDCPFVRVVNGYYEQGMFYVITYALSKKMKQIAANSKVAVCGEWFTAQGTGESLGWVRDEKNIEIMAKLRVVFAAWYDNGHTNEQDPNTCILRVRLTDGVLLSHGTRYEVDFVHKTV